MPRAVAPAALACLSLLATLTVSPAESANPVPADDISLLNGADLYQEYCAGCHGVDVDPAAGDLYATDPDDGLYDFSDVVERAFAEPAKPEVPENWPAWADPPEPSEMPAKPRGPTERELILEELNAAIDTAYQTGRGDDELSLDEFGDPYDEGALGEEIAAARADEERLYETGAGEEEARVPQATDLAAPGTFAFGTTEDELFDSIALGAGGNMPGMLGQLGSEEAVWNLVNYIRSLWGEDWQDEEP